MRGEDAGLDDSLAEGWLRKMVCVTIGGLEGTAGTTGCCLSGEAFQMAILCDSWGCVLFMFIFSLLAESFVEGCHFPRAADPHRISPPPHQIDRHFCKA